MSKPLFDFKAQQSYPIAQLNAEQARVIQNLLRGCGYNLAVDGIVGQDTVEQFMRFKMDNYLEYPSELGATTYNELIEESDIRQLHLSPSSEVSPTKPPGK